MNDSAPASGRASAPLGPARDPFGPHGERDVVTVQPDSTLSQAAFDVLLALAEEAAEYAGAVYNPEEEDDPEIPPRGEPWLPPAFEGRYDRDFLKAFWYVALCHAEAIRESRGHPIRFEMPADEIAFHVVYAMLGRIGDGTPPCEDIDPGDRASIVEEVRAYYAACRVDDGVERLYRLLAGTSAAALAAAGLGRLDFERWWPS